MRREHTRGFRTDLHRPDEGVAADRVGYMELFFDLVFVYAITAQAELLTREQSVTALLGTLVLGVAIWWTWISTAWVTNWLDPERGPVRALLIALMGASLVLSGTLGDALGDAAPVFGITLVIVNVGRPLVAIAALRGKHPDEASNFVHLSVWTLVSAPLWVIGSLGATPLPWWGAAVVVDGIGPLVRYVVPGIGRTPLHAWRIRGAHLAERVSLFVLIALGESIALIGEHVAAALGSVSAVLTLCAAFAHTVLLWFLYFNHGESLGSERIRGTDQTGAIARNTYTYTAALLVIGIVISAVGTDLATEHAAEAGAGGWTAGLLLGGTAVCLGGDLLFRTSLGDTPSWTHLAAVVVTIALYPFHQRMPAAVLTWAAVAVLGVVVVTDELSAGNSTRPATPETERVDP